MAEAKRRQWREYRTSGGGRPVYDFLKSLDRDDRVAVAAAMVRVSKDGLRAAKKLRGDIWEVKADTGEKFFRLLFAPQGRYGQVFLSLEAFAKKTNKTPPAKLKLAEDRLKDWRARGSKGGK